MLAHTAALARRSAPSARFALQAGRAVGVANGKEDTSARWSSLPPCQTLYPLAGAPAIASGSRQAFRRMSSSSDPAPAQPLGRAASAASSSTGRSSGAAAVAQRSRSPRSYPCFWTDVKAFAVRGVGGAGAQQDQVAAKVHNDPVSKVARRINRFFRKVAKNAWGALCDPRVIWAWGVDIWDIVKTGSKWIGTGGRLFRINIGTSWKLTKRVALGHALTIRERKLLTKTTADCLRIIPFSFFILIPFAELLLPIVLRVFPGMMPSTFFMDKYDDASLARKLKAKEQMAEFWQEVVAQRTQAILDSDNHEYADRANELQDFQEKLLSGGDYPTVKEMLRFSKLFTQEMQLSAMTGQQLRAMSKMLGLKPMTLPVHNQLQLRHHITGLRREDRDYLWEGIDFLTTHELIEACKKRAIRFHGVSEDEMRRDLGRWLEISGHKKIPTSLLLWIQSFTLTVREKEREIAEKIAETADGSKAPAPEIIVEPADKPEPEDFQVKVEAAPEVEAETKDAFDGMEQRQKKRLEQTEQRLVELEQELKEVMKEEEGVDNGGEAKEEKVATSYTTPTEDTAMELEQEEKRCILKRIEELSQAQHLNRVIIDRQQEMLQHQLEFMSHMRDNAPEIAAGESQDAGRILLDQRVRLVESMSKFKKDLNSLDDLVNEAETTENLTFASGDLDWISSLFDQLDMNKDGVISRREFEQAVRKSDAKKSENKDEVKKEEMEREKKAIRRSLAEVARSEATDKYRIEVAGAKANGLQEAVHKHKEISSLNAP